MKELTTRPDILHPEWSTFVPGNMDLAALVVAANATAHDQARPRTISSSGDLQHLLQQQFIPTARDLAFEDEDLRTNLMALHSWVHWVASGRPILRLDERLARMLADTEPPAKREVTELPVMPWDSLYLALPPIFAVQNRDTGDHPIEGVYLARDHVRLHEADTDADAAVPAILVVAVGKARGRIHRRHAMRNDALAFSFLTPWVESIGNEGWATQVDAEHFAGLGKAIDIGLNFLFMFNSTAGLTIGPQKRWPELPQPKSPSKQKKLRQRLQRRTHLPYFDLTVPSRVPKLSTESRPTPGGEPRDMHEVLVRGHFNRYWMREENVGGAQVLGRRENRHGTELCQVRKFIPPHLALRAGKGRQTREYQVR